MMGNGWRGNKERGIKEGGEKIFWSLCVTVFKRIIFFYTEKGNNYKEIS